MASKRTAASCASLMGKLRSGTADKWNDEEDGPYYAQVFLPIPDELAVRVAEYALDHLSWRPSRAELLDIIVQFAAPYPDAELAYAEIVDKMVRIGIVRPWEEREIWAYDLPRRKVKVRAASGTEVPEFTHPIVRTIVDLLGGWERLCNGKAEFAGALKRQVKDAHSRAYANYREGSIAAIRNKTLPPSTYEPYRLASDALPDDILARAIEAEREVLAIEAARTEQEDRLIGVPKERVPVDASAYPEAVEDALVKMLAKTF